MIMTMIRPAMIIYGVKALFFFRMIRQFGQDVSLGTTGVPHRGQVLEAIYSNILFRH
jgi:hypothetical protein